MTAKPLAGATRPTPPLRVLLGHVLRRHRLGQRRTLADVAHDAQVSTQYLSELERGRKEASSEVLAALCRSLHLDLADLLGEVRQDVLVLRGTAAADGSRLTGTGPVQRATAVRTVGRATPAQTVLRAA